MSVNHQPTNTRDPQDLPANGIFLSKQERRALVSTLDDDVEQWLRAGNVIDVLETPEYSRDDRRVRTYPRVEF